MQHLYLSNLHFRLIECIFLKFYFKVLYRDVPYASFIGAYDLRIGGNRYRVTLHVTLAWLFFKSVGRPIQSFFTTDKRCVNQHTRTSVLYSIYYILCLTLISYLVILAFLNIYPHILKSRACTFRKNETFIAHHFTKWRSSIFTKGIFITSFKTIQLHYCNTKYIQKF